MTETSQQTDRMWAMIHAERRRLGELLAGISDEQWGERSLCGEWTIEEAAAHLTAVAQTGTAAWIWSMARAGLDADRHNQRRMQRFLGDSPAETLATFNATVTSTVIPAKAYAAILGETIVHGQDIAQPLGLRLDPDPEAVAKVARFYAKKDFAVNSSTLVEGLRLEATDAPFAAGEGPLVSGPALALVTTMAGRPALADQLTGEGADELRGRLDP